MSAGESTDLEEARDILAKVFLARFRMDCVFCKIPFVGDCAPARA
jgi:hypothetical protein